MDNTEPMNSSATPLIEVESKMRKQIDPEIAENVGHDVEVDAFIESLRCTHVGPFTLTPTNKLVIAVLLFSIPSLWSIVSSLLPTDVSGAKMFFDSCTNHTANANESSTMPFKDCLAAAGWVSWVWQNATHTDAQSSSHTKNDKLRILAIIFSIFVAILASAVYGRLVVGEHQGWELLKFQITVRTEMSFSQLLPTIGVGLLFVATALIDVYLQRSVTNDLNNILLCRDSGPTATRCQATCGSSACNITASFNSDNPSTPEGTAPTTGILFFKAFLVILLPFLTVLTKVATAATTTFTQLTIDDLMTDVENASGVMLGLASGYEVTETALDSAIEELVEEYPPQPSTCLGAFRRLFVCDFHLAHPSPELFLWSYPDKKNQEVAIQRLCTILKQHGELKKYQRQKLVTAEGKEVERPDFVEDEEEGEGDDEESHEVQEDEREEGEEEAAQKKKTYKKKKAATQSPTAAALPTNAV